MTRLLHLGALAALLLASLALVGCGGGSDTGNNPPPPVGDFGSLSGKVVSADDVNAVLSGATVNVVNSSGDVQASGMTDGLGNFLLAAVPVGQWTVQVETPSEAVYGSQSVPAIVIANNARTTLTVTTLRTVDPPPTSITLSPLEATVDLHGQVDFDAQVVSGATVMSVTPVFLVPANIGVIDRNGVFTATQIGSGLVTAICGDMSATARVTVTGSRPPKITSFLVAPLNLTPSGGWVYVTAAANDGDGLATVKAEIYTPDGNVTTHDMTFNPASTDTYQLYSQTGSGTQLGYRLPANNNRWDATGFQAPQRYSIRVVVTDGAPQPQSSESDSVFVVVAGLDTPPPTQ